MKKILKKMYSDRAAALGYNKNWLDRSKSPKKVVHESVHMSSFSPVGRMGFNRDPKFLEDPAQVNGIEIGDMVAFASSPGDPLGELIGITGFREAIVRTDSGIREFKSDAVVKYSDLGDI